LSSRSWFGTNNQFARPDLPLYQDNSFTKHEYVLGKDQRRLNLIQKEFDKAKTNVEELRSQIHYSYITKKQLMTVFRRKQLKKEETERAAIKIQKFVRGFLIRKKFLTVKNTQELVDLQRKIVTIRLQGLEKTNKFYMFYLGTAPTRAAVIIQRSVRRLLFRLKIAKFIKYHEKLLNDRAEKIFSVIRKHLLVYAARVKIEITKFLKYRVKRLEQIKRKVAILQIAKIYRSNKWSFKVIKHKISKFKRRLRNANFVDTSSVNNLGQMNPITNHSSRARLSVQGSDFELEGRSPALVDEEASSSSSENERIMREVFLKRQEELRKEKIKFGKISHCVGEKPETQNILPLLYEKDISENLVQFKYSAITRATASRISESRPKRSSPHLFQSKTPTPFVRFISKRLESKPIPLYKRETISSKMSRWDAEPESDSSIPKISIRPRFNSTVRNFTFSQMQKRRSKPVKFEEKSSRPKTTVKIFREFTKKVQENRPYTMNSNVIVFNPS
jgi:hypothetical protein